MARFLLAWELGDGLGHASRFRPLAQGLRAHGHEVDLMLREIVHARSVLGDLGLRLLQAPFWMHQTVGGPNPTISLTEILVGNGYLQPDHLDGLVQGWLAALDLIRPDVLVADYAPTATIAARIKGIPVATVGGGFYLPPDASPLPPFRTWEPIEPGRVAYWEQRVTQTVNTVLARHGVPAVPRLSTILRGEQALLCCWPELDPYQRHDQRHTLPTASDHIDAGLGPTFLNEGGEAPIWPDGDGPCVFAYVRSTHGDLLPLLQALDQAGCRTLCYLPEVAAGRPAPLASPRIRYAGRPVDLAQALPQASLLISHAGEATLAQALLAGVPMLLLPTQAEQFLNAQRVVQLGAGLNAAAHGQPAPYAQLLQTLLHTASYRAAAQAMAHRYRDFRPDSLNQTLTAACESLLNGH
ncbi:glycosyltransferase [Aquabacterium sp. NJ1]|uniref:glycosyltransferase n=1 Tax=Aquabacterium sp. NJ1 TaxID=1538295 RepID=UPI00137909A7|nr:nucleotide disphospho-sugar-binding domain-containing protein [Aquabacterium sp. NJ1]